MALSEEFDDEPDASDPTRWIVPSRSAQPQGRCSVSDGLERLSDGWSVCRAAWNPCRTADSLVGRLERVSDGSKPVPDGGFSCRTAG